jgi:hypothetical protein
MPLNTLLAFQPYLNLLRIEPEALLNMDEGDLSLPYKRIDPNLGALKPLGYILNC